MRTALGILIGLALTAGALAGCGYALAHLHPLPPKFDPGSLRHATAYIASAPLIALALLALSPGMATFIGAWPAARIARRRGAAALSIGLPLMVLVIAVAALLPQPGWVPVVGMLLPIPFALAGWRLAIPRAEL